MRRASLSDRHNLRVKEYETEAIVWRGGREGGREEQEKEKETDQENSHLINTTVTMVSMDECFSYLTSITNANHICVGKQDHVAYHLTK